MKLYNKFYSENKYSRGMEPSEITLKLLEHTSAGEVLDIGCGEGQDSVFLALNGFEVTAIDTSEVAIKNLEDLAINRNVELQTILSDINDYKFERKFDVILAEGIIHFLKKKERDSFISKMIENTKIGGINAIGIFNTDTSHNQIECLNEWGINPFSITELKSHYLNWEILFENNTIQAKDETTKRGISQLIVKRIK